MSRVCAKRSLTVIGEYTDKALTGRTDKRPDFQLMLRDSALELKTLGQAVLGLRKGPDSRFEIDPATTPVVHRIFEKYASGERAKDIYRRLNDERSIPIHGGQFNKSSVRRIIQNEKYVDVYEFRDIRVEDGGNGKSGKVYFYYTPAMNTVRISASNPGFRKIRSRI